MYTIKISAPFFEHEATDEFEEISYEAIEEYVRDFLWSEIIDSLMSLYPVEPTGYFADVNDVGTSLYSFMETTVRNSEKIIAICTEKDPLPQLSSGCVEICLKGLFLDLVKESGTDESYCVNTGVVVEDSLYRFIGASTWHWGLQSATNGSVLEEVSKWPKPIKSDGLTKFTSDGEEMVPILWYGPSGSAPVPRWTISPCDTEEKAHFWFETEGHEIMENLQEDPDQTFLVWYLYECGRWYPDIEDIIHECPIQILEDDSISIISKKIYRFFESLVNQ